jgi:carboxyl-terminal processing protease
VDTKIPLVILVNRGSASASEIVAGSIQDLDRGIILGERTFGKGLVQATRKLKYNAQLKVTTAKYYIPSGRCIQALDYTHRNDDGSVGYVPDSLISEFKTRNGRKVLDGGGILPDVVDSLEMLSILSINLYAQNLIFDFATDYIISQSVPPAKENWRLDDKTYEDFKNFVNKQDFSYETRSENALESLIKTAKAEKYYGFAEEEFKALQEKLEQNNMDDLDLFKDEIIDLIEEEIMGRYYFQKGRIGISVKSDNQIGRARELASNKSKYNAIVNPSLKMAENSLIPLHMD